jgi:cytochrome c553
MRKPAFFILVTIAVLAWIAAATGPAERLHWEPATLTYNARTGEVTARLTFHVKNVSGEDVDIDQVKASCGCTVAQMPRNPWRMKPSDTDKLEVLVDLRNKTPGTLTKDIAIMTARETNILILNVNIPEGMTNGMSSAMADRIWGQQLAGVDHQAVFKNDCVKCHLEPAFGKYGGNLYNVACGICHEAHHRASMVPDLHSLTAEIDTNYWRNWVVNGKPGTLMPGFAATQGGPLGADQIDSLMDYLTNTFPRPMKKSPPPGKHDK